MGALRCHARFEMSKSLSPGHIHIGNEREAERGKSSELNLSGFLQMF